MTNRKTKIYAKLVILACGTNYTIQQKLGLIKEPPKEFGICYGGVFTDCNVDKNSMLFVFSQNIPASFWLFPNSSKEANVGVASLPKAKYPIKKAFHEFFTKFNGLNNAKKKTEFAGIFPVSGPIRKTYSGRVLVCGDAACFVYAGTGEGICYALESGKLAANVAFEALKNASFSEAFLKRYEKMWKKCFGRELKAGIMFLDFIKWAYKNKMLKRLFKAPNKRELQMIITAGRFPLRARIAYILLKFFRLL